MFYKGPKANSDGFTGLQSVTMPPLQHESNLRKQHIINGSNCAPKQRYLHNLVDTRFGLWNLMW